RRHTRFSRDWSSDVCSSDLGPDEVQNTVTKKIEDAVSSMENIKKLTSRSQEGVSIVTIELTTQADVDYSLQDAQRKINAVLSSRSEERRVGNACSRESWATG